MGTLGGGRGFGSVLGDFGLQPGQLPQGTAAVFMLQESMAVGEMADGKMAVSTVSTALRELLTSSPSAKVIHINLSGLAQPGQGLVFVYTDPDGLLGADAEVLVGLSDSASMQRVMLGGGAGRLPDVVAGGSGLPMTRLLFTEEERQALDTTFSVLKFKSSRLAFVNVYQPTTVHDGTPHYLEVAWRFKLLAAKAVSAAVYELRKQDYDVIIGMDANTDMTATFTDMAAPGERLQHAFRSLELRSAWGADDQATRGSRLIDFVFSNLEAVASGCVAPGQLDLKSDHSLVWAVYEVAKAAKRRRLH
ncbi:hypothetical protein COHA_008340 [Chlorella ohadii]|uniref:Uncharacterized protein n=1 Tax=Chlorella ohadii TaxID=2649997 RepID=A0AAD5DHM4_9CHLO|nr:hypothetical protein COHA_008340 [Chlorella ohadii]